MKRQRTVDFYDCDGCQYTIGKEESMITLPLVLLTNGGKHTIPFHFHPLSEQHDCLRYWMTGHGIIEHSLKDRNLPEAVKEELLRSLRYREKV